jgi:putative peptide zinc metalloprotease protein
MMAEEIATTTPTAPGVVRTRPLLAQGVELLGRLDGSGFREPPFMVRRQDGQMVQLPGLLYGVAERADGRHELGGIAEQLSHRLGRGISADDVAFLVEEKLRPLGILAEADGSSPRVQKANALLGLTWQKALVPDRGVRRITGPFLQLFNPLVVGLVVTGFLALDTWLLFVHGIGQPVRTALYQPAFLLALFGGVVLATAFHELGHATACRYSGARPGVIGAGIYVVWPVFYTDVTDAYRLPRSGRLRTDLGGVYFNAIFGLAVGAAYFATGFEPLLLLVLVQNCAILQQLMPFGRLDGYLIVSDLTGVPDILTRLGPILRSLVPWRPAGERVKQLKPWVRVVVSSYVLVLIPVLVAALTLTVLHAPRAFATAYDSLAVQADKVSGAFADNDIVGGLAGSLQVAALVTPCAGMTATTVRLGRRAGAAALAWTGGRPLRRGMLTAGATAACVLAAFTWWPNGEYRPIQSGERGTVQDGLRNAAHLPSGRPSLTVERENELRGAPSLRDNASVEQSPQRRQQDARGATAQDDGEPRTDRRRGLASEHGHVPDEEAVFDEGGAAGDEEFAEEPGATTPAPAPQEEDSTTEGLQTPTTTTTSPDETEPTTSPDETEPTTGPEENTTCPERTATTTSPDETETTTSPDETDPTTSPAETEACP